MIGFVVYELIRLSREMKISLLRKNAVLLNYDK